MNCEIPNRSVFSPRGQVTSDCYHHTDIRENTGAIMDNMKPYYGFSGNQQQGNTEEYDHCSSSFDNSNKNSNDRNFGESVKCIPSPKINNNQYQDSNYNVYEQSEYENNRNIGNVYNYQNYIQNSRNCYDDLTRYEKDDNKSEIANNQDTSKSVDYRNANTQDLFEPQVSADFDSKDTLSTAPLNDNLQTGKTCVNLRNRELWLKFYEHTTEMIITKQGR